MHALEAAAMDDPFLADALEGYNAIAPATVPADIKELRARLNERSKDTKIIPLPNNDKWWRVAAVLIFLSGASLLTYKLLQQDNSNTLAKKDVNTSQQENTNANTAPVLEPDTLTATSGSTSSRISLYDSLKDVAVAKNEAARGQDLSANTIEEKSAPPKFEASKPGVDQHGNASAAAKTITSPASVPDLTAYKKKDSLQLTASKEDDRSQRDSIFVAQNNASKDAERLQSRTEGVQTQTQNQASNRHATADANNQFYVNNFSGRVVDPQNNAIPFASVRVNNNNQVAASNNDGYFQIKSTDSVLDLSVTSVGYQSRQLTLRGNQPVQEVALEPFRDKKMSEVVVSGASQKRKSAEKPSNLNVYVMDAQPVNGWDEYNKYLSTSKRLDDANRGLKGEVVVSFWVNKRGQLSDFTVEKSLGRWHDAEAIRLVKEGPAWKLLKGKGTRARVIVGF